MDIMMKKLKLTLVTYEQSMKLKELGFPQLEDEKWYSTYLTNEPEVIDYESKYPDICAPSLELVAKWLRNEKDIFININYISIGYSSWVKTIAPNKYITENLGYVDSYEKALSNGINAALNYLKEQKNL